MCVRRIWRKQYLFFVSNWSNIGELNNIVLTDTVVKIYADIIETSADITETNTDITEIYIQDYFR